MPVIKRTKEEEEKRKKELEAQTASSGEKVSNPEILRDRAAGGNRGRGGLGGADRVELAQQRAVSQGKPEVAPTGINKQTGELLQTPEVQTANEAGAFEIYEQPERVNIAEEARAFQPLPPEPIQTIPGDLERGNFRNFLEGVRNSGFAKAYRYIDTLGGALELQSPEVQQAVVVQAQKDEISDDLQEQIDNTEEELDKQLTQFGFGSVAGAALIGGAAAEADIGGIFFASKDKIDNFKGSIEALNQMSTTISSAAGEGSLDGATALRMQQNIRKILDLRRQQIKQIAIGSPSVRVSQALVEIDTDLFEAQVENQLETNKVASLFITGQAEPTQAQLLVTKRRIEKLESNVKKTKSTI